jgi:hypothetical protein
MNGSSAVLVGLGVAGVGAAGYAAYRYVNRGPSTGVTAPGPYNPYSGQPGWQSPPYGTQPGNPGNPNPAPAPKPPADDVARAANDAKAWVDVARSLYGLASDVVGDISDAANTGY